MNNKDDFFDHIGTDQKGLKSIGDIMREEKKNNQRYLLSLIISILALIVAIIK